MARGADIVAGVTLVMPLVAIYIHIINCLKCVECFCGGSQQITRAHTTAICFACRQKVSLLARNLYLATQLGIMRIISERDFLDDDE